MKPKIYSIAGKLEMFDEVTAPWTYLFIPFEKVPDVDAPKIAWGAIPVEATIGKTTWRTSIFKLRDEGYFLPVKKAVLKKEGLKSGDPITANYFTNKKNF